MVDVDEKRNETDKREAARKLEVERQKDSKSGGPTPEPNAALYGVDVNSPDFRGPNGITMFSVGPKLPKAAGELQDIVEGDRFVQRQVEEDDAVATEGKGVFITAPKGEGIFAKTAEEQGKPIPIDKAGREYAEQQGASTRSAPIDHPGKGDEHGKAHGLEKKPESKPA